MARAPSAPKRAKPGSGKQGKSKSGRGKRDKTTKRAAGSTGSRSESDEKGLPRRASRRGSGPRPGGDATLFAPLSPGERADALRTLMEDKRLASMAKVGRYRVSLVEPMPVKVPHPLATARLARVVLFDYSSDRSVDAGIDLDCGEVVHLTFSRAQPLLVPEEEAAAVAIAAGDDRVKAQLSLADEPQVAMHYWSHDENSLLYGRRSAAVIFGPCGQRPSFIAVVDLVGHRVTEVVAAQEW